MKYQNVLDDKKVQCLVCPRECVLNEEQSGFCHVRKNIGGQVELTTYGYNTGLNVDPVEKKPLYHFYPTTKVLSLGTLGCNMGCVFCQNAHLSRSKDDPSKYTYASPEDIVDVALKNNCISIAYTYNDPVIFYEYAKDTAKIAREHGIKNIAVTAGFMNPQIYEDFFEYIDAVNIDLKAFNNDFYKKNCLAELEPVLETIKYAANNTDTWVELTTLLIEGENDSKDEIKKECEWIISNIGEHVPLHFSAFFPAGKFSHKKPTNPQTLYNAYKMAEDIGLKYVYTGNLASVATSTTHCENCRNDIIVRDGYRVLEYNLEKDGFCRFCGHKCHGCFE